MKSWRMAAAVGLAIASVSVWAAPGGGITGTKHDWSSAVSADGTSGGQSVLLWWNGKTGTAAAGITNPTTANPVPWTGIGANGTDAGTQLTTRIQIGQCTKCHTPHQAKSTNLLWNHTLSTNTYQWDVPATTAGTTYATFKGDTYKGPTTKCLSCHDGSIASTDGMWFNRGWNKSTKYVGAWSGHEVASEAGSMVGTHPVAMPYPFNNAKSTYNLSTTGDDANLTDWVADPKALGIRMFKDDGAGNITAGTALGKTGIECSSCHDVHNGSRVKDSYLVTGKINGSDRSAGGYICTQCHVK